MNEADAGFFQFLDQVDDVEFRLILHRDHPDEDLLELLANAFGYGLQTVRFAGRSDARRG